jgi:hypothetical protein
MATTPTTNPIPSTAPQDLLFNAEKLDQFVNSTAATYTDRFGVVRSTLAGLACSDLNTSLAVSPKDFGATGDGSADDKAALLLAFATGRVVDGGGASFGVSGTMTPAAFGGLINATLVQLAPATSECKTLNVVNFDGFVIDELTINRGGSAGYTVGTIGSTATWAGLRIENCDHFTIGRIRVTNGGRGTGVALIGCTNFEPGRVTVDEHYWQEVNPGSPVITDDVLQPWWINNCSNFSQFGWIAKNCTTGAAGSPTTGVAASQVRNYSRNAYSGCTKATVIGNLVENVAQAFDFTGSGGNSDMIVAFNVARHAGVSGFKWANSANNLQVFGNYADTPDQYGFLVSGMTEVSNPVVQHIQGMGNRVRNCGGLAGKYRGSTAGFSVEAQLAIDISYPRSVVWDSCWVIDDRRLTTTAAVLTGATSATLTTAFTLASGAYEVVFSNGNVRTVTFTNGATTMTWSGGLSSDCTVTIDAPTTNIGFRNNVAARAPADSGYLLPNTVRCSGDCRVIVPGLAGASHYFGIHSSYAVLSGNVVNTDTVATSTWGTTAPGGLIFDGTEHQDPSAIHSTSVAPDSVYIKEGGLYAIDCQTAFAANATGSRSIRVEINSGNVEILATVSAHPTLKTWVRGHALRLLYPGDVVRVTPWQDSGGNLAINRGDSSLSIVRIGAV